MAPPESVAVLLLIDVLVIEGEEPKPLKMPPPKVSRAPLPLALPAVTVNPSSTDAADTLVLVTTW